MAAPEQDPPKRGRGRPKGSGAGRTFTARIDLVVEPERKEAYESAAAAKEMALGEWVRAACDAAVARASRKRRTRE